MVPRPRPRASGVRSPPFAVLLRLPAAISTLEPDRLARLTSAGDPIVSDDRRHPGELSSWVAEDDRSTLLVLASGRVVWGRELA